MIEENCEILNRTCLTKTNWQSVCKTFENCSSAPLFRKYILKNFGLCQVAKNLYREKLLKAKLVSPLCGEKREKEIWRDSLAVFICTYTRLRCSV